MAVHEMGPKDGFPVVLCHGFPELAYSWRHQLPALAAAGYRAIAPDQRGYGGTSRPEKIEDYDMAHLTGDMTGLLDALGLKKAVFCGHDWGGMVVWQMALRHPDRVAGRHRRQRNTPFFPHRVPRSIPSWRCARCMARTCTSSISRSPATPRRSWRRMSANRSGSSCAKTRSRRKNTQNAPKASATWNWCTALQSDRSHWPGEVLLTPEELKVFVDTFTHTGFTGGINWYRNFSRNLAAVRKARGEGQRATGLNDHGGRRCRAVAGHGGRAWSASCLKDLEKTLIRRCGHWTQQERLRRRNQHADGRLAEAAFCCVVLLKSRCSPVPGVHLCFSGVPVNSKLLLRG